MKNIGKPKDNHRKQIEIQLKVLRKQMKNIVGKVIAILKLASDSFTIHKKT